MTEVPKPMESNSGNPSPMKAMKRKEAMKSNPEDPNPSPMKAMKKVSKKLQTVTKSEIGRTSAANAKGVGDDDGDKSPPRFCMGDVAPMLRW